MPEIKLQRGDVFAVYSDSWLADRINGVSAFYSTDGESQYNHAGIITSESGGTFEALKKLDFYHLDNYIGRPIIIARPQALDSIKHLALLKLVQRHRGQNYPWWRILLHLVQPIARKVSHKGRYVVCSELTAKYEFLINLRHGGYTGTTPDQLADEWRHWREYDVIFEGEWQ